MDLKKEIDEALGSQYPVCVISPLVVMLTLHQEAVALTWRGYYPSAICTLVDAKRP